MPKVTARRSRRTRGQGIRRRITIGGAVTLALGLVAAVLLTLYVGNRALVAKDSLESAQTELTTFRSALGQPNAPSTAKLYRAISSKTAKAAEQVNDPVWAAYETLPVLGPNLKAFRQTAVLVDALVRDGVGPIAAAADGVSVESLKPKNGGIDIAPLPKLTPAIADLDEAMTAADRSAAAIDTTDVIPQLKGPIAQVQALVKGAQPTVRELRKVMPVLYPVLGGDGTRHYLLIFQNNAEERASGGNPASMAMLTVKSGKISLGKQASSGNFPKYRTAPYTPSGPGSRDWDRIYTDYASTYVTNITMTPDFPSTAKMARAMWRDRLGGKVDGVISFDPVALSYLMRATGPVKLIDGTTITAENAVSYLLYGVYAKHRDPATQDAVFASAAQKIFAAITNGQGDPKAYLAQLDPMMREQRLKMWSIHSNEQDLLKTSPMWNMLPADNLKSTVLGVYNNDDATSKMSYFMDERVSVAVNTCKATPKYTISAKVINILKPDQIGALPEYVRAHQPRINPGGDRQWVQVYGPVGSKLSAVYIDGVKVVWGTNFSYKVNTNYSATGELDHRPAVKGKMYDRPVGVVSLNIDPSSSKTVKAVFTGGDANSKTVSVSHTPKVRETPVTITAAKCG